MRNMLLKLIRLYQNTFSPDHGPLRHVYPYGYCRHTPTCSEYAAIQIQKRGIVIGCALAFWRILHCTPWSKPSEKKILEITKR